MFEVAPACADIPSLQVSIPRADRHRDATDVLTGYPHHAINRRALDQGPDRLLLKPCLPEDLERHVNELLQLNHPAAKLQ